jgi:integrase
MKGSVTKYNIKNSSRPRWRYRIYLGKDALGKKLYDSSGAGFRKEADAVDAMRSRMREIEAERTGKPAPKISLGEWLQTWLDTYGRDRCQPKTLERYRQLAAYVIEDQQGNASALSVRPLAEVSHTELESFLFALLEAMAKRRKHISARTIRHIAGVLNVALNKAFRLELIAVNPMQRVELPTAKKQDARSLTPEEIRSLREGCKGDWTFALVEIALGTGARRGELLALQWADLDWLSGVLTISKSLEQTAGGLRVKSPKNGKTRVCKLPHSAFAALQFQRDQQRENQRLFAGDYETNGLIFCEADGSYHEPDLVSQVIIRRMRKAGIRDGSFHTLRHTHASNLLSRGVPLPAVSARLGHSDTNVTARVYSHALPADDERAAEVWDTIVQ